MAWEATICTHASRAGSQGRHHCGSGRWSAGGVKAERPTPDLGEAADRMWAGAKLYNAGKAPKVLLTGGSQPWNGLTTSEADGMADLMISLA